MKDYAAAGAIMALKSFFCAFINFGEIAASFGSVASIHISAGDVEVPHILC